MDLNRVEGQKQPAEISTSGEKPKAADNKPAPAMKPIERGSKAIAQPKILALEGRAAARINSTDQQKMRELTAVVLSTPGINNLDEGRRKLVNANLGMLIRDIRVTPDPIKVVFRDGIIYIGASFAHSSKDDIQREVANAIVSGVWREYMSVHNRLNNEEVTAYLNEYFGLMDYSGLYDFRINTIEMLASPSIPVDVRKEVESIVEREIKEPRPLNDPERKNRLFSVLTRQFERVLAVYAGGKGDISREYEVLQVLSSLAGQMGITDEELSILYHDRLKTDLSTFNNALDPFKGLSRKNIWEKFLKLCAVSVPQEDIRGTVKNLIATSVIWGEFFPKVTADHINEEIIRRREDPRLGADLMNFEFVLVKYLSCRNSADFVLAANALRDGVSSLAAKIPTYSKSKQKIARDFLIRMIAEAYLNKIISQFDSETLTLKVYHPEISDEQLSLFVRYSTLRGALKSKAREYFLNKYAEHVREALNEKDRNLRDHLDQKARSYFNIINHCDIASAEELLMIKLRIENPEMSESQIRGTLPASYRNRFRIEAEYFTAVRKIESLRETYQKIMNMAYETLYRNEDDEPACDNEAFFAEAWKNAENVSERIMSVTIPHLKEIAEIRNDDIPGSYDFQSAEQVPAIEASAMTPLGRKKAYAGALFDLGTGAVSELFGTVTSFSFAIKTPFRRAFMARLRNNVIDSSRMSSYLSAEDPMFWNIHLRIQEARQLLTEGRVRSIKKYALKYGIDPNLVAGIILAEQRDQTLGENITDRVGGIISNTSVGLGQVTISTARKLFPELKNSSNNEVAGKLEDEEFNIEAVARMARYIIDEGTRTLKKQPSVREIGTRYTSADFFGLSEWGRFVEISCNDVGMSGIFTKEIYPAISRTRDLSREMIRELNPG